MSQALEALALAVEILSEPFTVTRRASGTFDSSGIAHKGTPTTIGITASVQPITGRELERLSEGRKNEEWIDIYADTQLSTEGTAQGADLITVNGETFEVEMCQRWDAIAGYWHAKAKLVPRLGN